MKKSFFGLEMFTKRRLDIMPTRIQGMNQLTAILDKAKEIDQKTYGAAAQEVVR